MDEYCLIPLHRTVAREQFGVRVGGALPVEDGQQNLQNLTISLYG